MKTVIRLLLTAALLPMLSYTSVGREPEKRAIRAIKVTEAITVDGLLNELQWEAADIASDFWLNFPNDSSLARNQTRAHILYDDQYIYVGAVLTMGERRGFVASSLKRDFPFLENDAFGVVLDPFDDRTNGYGFYVSAYGVQRDEQIYSGTTSDATWDVKWTSAVRQHENGWSVELAIPLRYLRFRENSAHWNINFLRNDVGNNESSSWAATPRYFSLGNLAFSGTLQWPGAIHKTAKNISLIPNTTVYLSQHRKEELRASVRPSLDAKVAITPSLNLDLTVNPDFSQAQADQAQVNLTRSELVFPEKRLFFVENSDLFSQFGVDKWGTFPIRPFYSRRIGLRYNESTGLNEQTRIMGGLRLSGKVNNNLRIGAMNIQTAREKIYDAETGKRHFYPGQNYTAFALQHKTFSRSNIGFIFSQRQAVGNDSTSRYSINKEDFSRLAGVDYNLASSNGKWTGKLFHHILFENSRQSSAQGGLIQYTTKRTLSWLGLTRADSHFTPDAGFVPRSGFLNVYGELSYFLYPKNKTLNFIQPVLHYTVTFDSLAGKKTDSRFITGAQWKRHNTSYLYLLLFKDYTRLTSNFNPSRNDNDALLPAGTDYHYTYFRIYYVSDIRKKFSWHIYSDVGEFYNGKILMLSGYLNRKIEPYGMLGVDYNTTFLQMPAPHKDNAIYLVGPRADISFSRSLFLNTVLQYNTQTESVNFYTRLQWRFRPLSDLYVVYTNNKSTNPWQREDQNLVIKMVWWL